MFGTPELIVAKLNAIENSTVKSSFHFKKGLQLYELIQFIQSIHPALTVIQMIELYDNIRKVDSTLGSTCTFLSVDSGHHSISKSAIVIRKSAFQSYCNTLCYDCFIHTISFHQQISIVHSAIASLSIAFAYASVIMSEQLNQASLALAMYGTTAAYSFLKIRPQRPDYVEEALHLLLLESMKTRGVRIGPEIRDSFRILSRKH